MKRFYEQKTVDNSVLDVSESDRLVKVAIAHIGSKDLDNDIIEHGAFTKTVTERGPAGANLIWHLTDHNPSLKSAVGKFKDLSVQGDYLVGVTDIPKTTWGNDVLELYKTGHINQHSIGYKTIKREIKNEGQEDEYRMLKELFLYEGSSVLWGANPNTPVLKSLTIDEAISEQEKISKEMVLLSKSLRDGRVTDETFELIEIRLAQLNESFKSLIALTTQPVITVEPDNSNEMIETIKQFTKLIK